MYICYDMYMYTVCLLSYLVPNMIYPVESIQSTIGLAHLRYQIILSALFVLSTVSIVFVPSILSIASIYELSCSCLYLHLNLDRHLNLYQISISI